ncbi:hypothetical protein FRC06_001026 [Ceratobasidium sp. 370]|nr:hypothetical protein FRC06_001026 [Ceratobasidium sp. 370]
MEAYRTMAGTIMHSVYGFRVEEPNEIFVLKLKEALDNIAKASVDLTNLRPEQADLQDFYVGGFPALVRLPDWFPCTGWKKTAKEWRGQKEDAVDGPYNWTKLEMEKGEHDPSMIESMLGQARGLGMDSIQSDDYVKQIAFVLFAGGTDTTVSVILVFFVAMLLYPEVQKKAQAEIDLVLGSDRLPTMEDQSRLPYIGRLIQELLRWCPALPYGLPHVCQQDDIYKGYRIPKGAIVFGNIWAITRNVKVYKDPETFNPDRFLDPAVPPSPTFGFGRRVCPGVHYARSALFIFIASILAAFDIEMAKDEQGNDLVPVAEADDRAVYHPLPFKFKLGPRSSAYEQLIRTGV